MRAFTFFVVLCLFTLFTGCGGSNGSLGDGNNTAVSPLGGTVTTAGEQVTLDFPMGAIDNVIDVSAEPCTECPVDAALVSGTAFTFAPNVTFAKPVQLTIRYDATQLPEGVAESTLRLVTVVNDTWEEIADSSVDTAQHAVTGAITAFGVYGIRGAVNSKPPAGTVIGVNGGTVNALNGRVRLVFPAGAVTEDTSISVQSTAAFPADEGVVSGLAFAITPAIALLQPVQMICSYDGIILPANLPEESLRLSRVDGNAWFDIAGCVVDQHGNMVTGFLDALGTIAVRGTLGAPEPYAMAQAWGSQGSGEGQFDIPSALALDGRGQLYVADTGNHRVQAFDTDGAFVAAWGSYGKGDGQLNGPTGIVLTSDGYCCVADRGNHRVTLFNETGSFRGWLGRNSYLLSGYHAPGSMGDPIEGTGHGEFRTPCAVAVDPAGKLAVLDDMMSRVQYFSRWAYQRSWGSIGHGNGAFVSPTGIAIDTAGNAYIAEQGNHRIQKLTSTGEFLKAIGSQGSEAGQLMSPAGIALDAEGNIYVVEYGNHRIQKFDPQGNSLAIWGRSGSGKLYQPTGIAVDADGNVYIADCGNHRIVKFAPVP
jgi:hypothetical protein